MPPLADQENVQQKVGTGVKELRNACEVRGKRMEEGLLPKEGIPDNNAAIDELKKIESAVTYGPSNAPAPQLKK